MGYEPTHSRRCLGFQGSTNIPGEWYISDKTTLGNQVCNVPPGMVFIFRNVRCEDSARVKPTGLNLTVFSSGRKPIRIARRVNGCSIQIKTLLREARSRLS